MIGSKQSQERYKEAHYNNQLKKYPNTVKDGLYSFWWPNGKPSAKLTNMVCNYLEWMGHEANRIDTKGTAVIDKKASPKFSPISGQVEHQTKVKFIPTQTKKGTGDISVKIVHPKHPFGVPLEIEIKINDKQSERQLKRESELKNKNLWYEIVHNMDEFFEMYDKKIFILDNATLF